MSLVSVFDVDLADKAAKGCKAHKSPECLCDVDVSLTADISWDRGPAALLGVETPQELARCWERWVFENEIMPRVQPLWRIIEHGRTWGHSRYFGRWEDDGPLVKKTAWWGRVGTLPEDRVRELVTRLRAGESPRAIAEAMGLPDDPIRELSRVIGATYKRPRPTHCPRNHPYTEQQRSSDKKLNCGECNTTRLRATPRQH